MEKKELIFGVVLGLIIGLILGSFLFSSNDNNSPIQNQDAEIVSKTALGFEPWSTQNIKSVSFSIEDDGAGTKRTDITGCFDYLKENYESSSFWQSKNANYDFKCALDMVYRGNGNSLIGNCRC